MPIDPSVLPIFLLSAFVLLIVPGPAVLFTVSRTIEEGRRAGIVSVLGLATGACVHIACSILGVTAILEASTVAFDALRYAGAAYLIYLGVRRLLTPVRTVVPSGTPRVRLRRAYIDGFIVNVLNPKSALFLLAFLPQFVNPALGRVDAQLATLGGCFVVLAILSDGFYALAAGGVAGRLRTSKGPARFQRYGAGTLYVGLGLAAALSGSRSR